MALIVAADAVSRGITSWAISTPFRVAIMYNLVNGAVTHVVFRVLQSRRLKNPENNGWDNTIYPIIIDGPISVAAGMITTYLLMKVTGDPVTVSYRALMLLASLAGMVFVNALAKRESESVTSLHSGRYQNELLLEKKGNQ
jgi:hypothetical protein